MVIPDTGVGVAAGVGVAVGVGVGSIMAKLMLMGAPAAPDPLEPM